MSMLDICTWIGLDAVKLWLWGGVEINAEGVRIKSTMSQQFRQWSGEGGVILGFQ
jgi:hypothetical protein